MCVYFCLITVKLNVQEKSSLNGAVSSMSDVVFRVLSISYFYFHFDGNKHLGKKHSLFLSGCSRDIVMKLHKTVSIKFVFSDLSLCLLRTHITLSF